eukprot:CFRG6395T1
MRTRKSTTSRHTEYQLLASMESTVGLSSDPNLEAIKSSNTVDLSDVGTAGVSKQPITAVLLLSVLTMSIQSFIFGIGIGSANNSAPAMKWDGTGSEFPGDPATFSPPITEDQFSWVLSLFAIGGMIGGVFGGQLVKITGPKWASIATDVVFVVAGVIMALSSSYGMLIAGRIVLGVGAGLCCNSVPIYNNDVAPIHVRGAFGVLHQLFVTIGIFVASILGMQSIFGTPDLWWVLWGSPVAFGSIHAVIFFFLPDSPKHLFEKGYDTQAKAALLKLRGGAYDATSELDDFYAEKKKAEEEGTLSIIDQFRLIFSHAYIKQITIGIVLMIGQQLSGINAVMFYSNSIFAAAGMDNAEAATIMVSGFNVLTTFPAISVIERAGRKFLLVAGFGGQGVMHVLFVISLVFSWQWPSVIFVLLGVGCFAIGPGPIPWMITAELLPAKISPAGVSVCVVINWLFTFIVGQVYPYMNDGMNEYSFLPFALFCFLTVTFTFIMIPETKGKTTTQIEAMFGNA